MERSQKKNSIMDIYVQSLKKDASFYKDKMEQQANELKEMRLQLSQERQKQKEEMDALKDELAQMVREVSRVKSENMSLLEQLEEYESTYVPGSGSKKLKDALGEARRELRETIEKYNELVDCYDAAKAQSEGTCNEARALRTENDDLRSDLERSRQMYQSVAKELEDNRTDMATLMTELSELRHAMESSSLEPEKSEPAPASAPAPASSSTADARLIASLRGQVNELTTILQSLRGSTTNVPTSSQSMSDVQRHLNALSQQVTTLLASVSNDDNPSIVGLISTVAKLRVSASDLSAALSQPTAPSESPALRKRLQEAEKEADEWRRRAEEAELRAGELQVVMKQPVSSSELSKRATTAERKVLELSQRVTTLERNVNELAKRSRAAEQKVTQLTGEKESLKRQLESAGRRSSAPSLRETTLQKQVDSLTAEKESLKRQLDAKPSGQSSRESTLQKQVESREKELAALRGTVMGLERELEECHRELEKVRPPVPALPVQLEEKPAVCLLV